MYKPQLILDVAGVILTNLTPLFWQEISASSGISYEELKGKFKQEIRDDLWNGTITEDVFWEWINKNSHSNDLFERNTIIKYLKPLPAMNYLEDWSEIADIHLLSNHREEWIMPILEPKKPFISTITISSMVGFNKPNIKIFNFVHAQLNINRPLLYVDDNIKNIESAQTLGWKTLIADIEGNWINEMPQRLKDI